jgi:hypothetical protein
MCRDVAFINDKMHVACGWTSVAHVPISGLYPVTMCCTWMESAALGVAIAQHIIVMAARVCSRYHILRTNIITDSKSAGWVSQDMTNISGSKLWNSNQPETNAPKRNLSDSIPPAEIDTKSIVPGTIRVTCVDRTFDLVRVDYLSFDEMRKQVAQLLWCDPRELIAIASDIDMEFATEHLEKRLAAFWTHASRIHFSLSRTEDVEMDGT